MNEHDGPKPPEGSGAENSGANRDEGSGQYNQRIEHAPVTARVPERVARGVFSTGVIIIDGPYEFVLDFVMGLVQPRQVVARVILTPVVVEQFIHALREKIGKYEGRFGKIPEIPRPPTPPRQPTIQEIYDDLKMTDDTLAGTYANAVMMAHGTSEFTFDFITRFFPTAAVAARVFLAAPQVPKMMESLAVSLNRYKQRMDAGRNQQPPAGPGPQGPGGPPLSHPPMGPGPV
jgi:hypothetical protein